MIRSFWFKIRIIDTPVFSREGKRWSIFSTGDQHAYAACVWAGNYERNIIKYVEVISDSNIHQFVDPDRFLLTWNIEKSHNINSFYVILIFHSSQIQRSTRSCSVIKRFTLCERRTMFNIGVELMRHDHTQRCKSRLIKDMVMFEHNSDRIIVVNYCMEIGAFSEAFHQSASMQ